jgi:hypothetical protein
VGLLGGLGLWLLGRDGSGSMYKDCAAFAFPAGVLGASFIRMFIPTEYITF